MSSGRMEVSCAGEKWCPVTATAKLVGRKWHIAIITELFRADGLGFNDLQRALGDISNKVLSETLEDLEQKGFVDRSVVNDKPVRVEYTLTELGESLQPIVMAMGQWGTEHLEAPEDEETVSLPSDWPCAEQE